MYAWAILQSRLARRHPDTALVHVINPKEAHHEGTLILYRIDKVRKSLVEAHYYFLCREE